jgi:(R,R)-butanediol dehydrogenase/meso-butanediol dehydrogenase/diacetyl reductase
MLKEKRVLALHDIEEPEAGDNTQLITVEAVSIGGSEYLGFNNPGIRPLPNIMGHGFTGTTAEGTRVAIYPLSGCGNCQYCSTNQEQLCDEWSLIGVQTDGGFAQQVLIPNEQLFELPEDISWEQSVFIEPFANSINAWEISEASENDSVAIVGAGGLGLGLVSLAHKAGCKNIHVAELSPSRINATKILGATHTAKGLNTTYDIVFDTVGSMETRNQTISSAKKGGKCIFLGFETPELTINMSEIVRHQKDLKGSFVYSRSQFRKAIELAKSCDKDWVKNISFEEVEKILVGFIDGEFNHIKVALRPNNV